MTFQWLAWTSLICVLVSGLSAQQIGPRPADVSREVRRLIGEYVAADTLIVHEKDGMLQLGRLSGPFDKLSPAGEKTWTLSTGRKVEFRGGPRARPDSVLIGGNAYRRRALDAEDGATFRIVPLFSEKELIRRAKAATPPVEKGSFKTTDLVELRSLDSTIWYDIRYASKNNFMGQQFYSLSRAYLQRPAAEGAARAHAWLRQFGYGLLVHDAYRPWSVTKMFWDATPDAMKEVFVANPSKGSRHNRGCALDATLYHLDSGIPADMVSGYDEFSERAFPHYPGGTSLQRWHRELLKTGAVSEGSSRNDATFAAVENGQGIAICFRCGRCGAARYDFWDSPFKVYEWEWWHFDYAGWEQWRIGVMSFEELERGVGRQE